MSISASTSASTSLISLARLGIGTPPARWRLREDPVPVRWRLSSAGVALPGNEDRVGQLVGVFARSSREMARQLIADGGDGACQPAGGVAGPKGLTQVIGEAAPELWRHPAA